MGTVVGGYSEVLGGCWSWTWHTYNCLHRVIILQHPGATTISCWSAVKQQLPRLAGWMYIVQLQATDPILIHLIEKLGGIVCHITVCHYLWWFLCIGGGEGGWWRINQSKTVTPRCRWGTPTDDSAVMAAHWCLSSATRSNDDIDWPVHALMLSFHDLPVDVIIDLCAFHQSPVVWSLAAYHGNRHRLTMLNFDGWRWKSEQKGEEGHVIL